MGEHDVGVTVGEHHPDAHGRVGGVHRHVRRACLEDPEQPDHHLHRSLDEDADHRVGPGAELAQVSSDGVGPLVQLAVGQPVGPVDEGDDVGRAVDLGLEQLVDARARRVLTGGGRVPRLHHNQLGGGHARQGLADGRVGVIDDRREHLDQQVTEPLDRCRGEAAAVVRQLEVGLRVEVGEQCQREVGLVVEVEVARRERPPELLQPGALVALVDDDDRVEQRGGAGLGDCLDVGERGVLVGPLVDLLGAHALEQLDHRLGGIDRDPHRRRVDEQTHDRLAARQPRPPAAARRAEHDVGGAGEGRQHEAPGGLDQHRPAHPMALGEGVPPLADVGRQGEPQRAVLVLIGADLLGPFQRQQPGRRVEPLQQRRVVRLGRLAILGQVHVQPLDVVLVRAPLGELGDLAAPRRVVRAERLLGHPHDARVEQRVVVGEHEPLPPLADAEQRQPPQRGGVELEPGTPIVHEEPSQPLLLLPRRQVAQVVHGERHVDVLDDLLHGLVAVGPAEPGAHDRVTVGDALPRRAHHVGVDLLGEVADELLDVDADVAPLEAVEEHPLLDRSERELVDCRRSEHRANGNIATRRMVRS